jgi:hypothetical protein
LSGLKTNGKSELKAPTGIEPVYYTDPDGGGGQRYYDGQTWTDARAPAATGSRTSGFAVASLVLGILWIWGIGSILAIIFGAVAKRRIREGAGLVTGGGVATAGIVLGIIGVIGVLLMILVVATDWASFRGSVR